MFTLPSLPYEYDALEPFIDSQTMHLHHEKHHATYIKNLNDALEGHPDQQGKTIEQLLSKLQDIPEDIRTKVRNNGGGHYNHSLFWTGMAPSASATLPGGELSTAITNIFGSVDILKEKMTTAGTALFGSGWVWLVKKEGNIDIVTTSNQDSPLTQGATPLVGIDVWEHAYYLKYQNRRIEYLTAWWNVANWVEAEKRLTSSS